MPEAPTALPPIPWDGRTYYGRPQLKPAPFNIALVGSYVFLAGLSGGAQLLAMLLEQSHGPMAAPATRRGRLLSWLAPTVGAACLILDLHTPQRFYNMLRVFKLTSPMSIGSWILVGFGGSNLASAVLQAIASRIRPLHWLQSGARLFQAPASLAAAGMCTYTAALFAATSAPRWAASPVNLAIRFGAASIASAAAALGLGEGRSRIGRDLDGIAVAALATELAALLGTERDNRRAGIAPAESAPLDVLSIALPLGLFTASLLLTRRRSRWLTATASLAALGGTWAMRLGVLREGAASARDPATSLRFAQPDNLPQVSPHNGVRRQTAQHAMH